ncbi:hypothetical protein Tco_0371193 [Tanacetum coccineum]
MKEVKARVNYEGCLGRNSKIQEVLQHSESRTPNVRGEHDAFTPLIRYFDLPKKTWMPSNVKTYDGSDDQEDHLKKFQAAAKQIEWESIEDFVQRFKNKSRHVKRAPECMRISGFMHGITNPEVIKRIHKNLPKLVDEMMKVTTAFLRGDVATSNQERKKYFWHRSNRKLGGNIILTEGEILGTSKDQSGDVTNSRSSQNL